MNTHALTLFTRAKIRGHACDACLLIYTDPIILDSPVSEDVRTIFTTRPSTAHVYIVAPFAPTDKLISTLCDGVALKRATTLMVDGGFHVLGLHEEKDALKVKSNRLLLERETGAMTVESPEEVDPLLIRGWLFDLFERGNGLVTAPLGVHFRKGSGKHTNRFLRTANVLLSSHACAILAFFALPAHGAGKPKRIFVDTAPLISVVQAMIYIANRHGLWSDYVSIKSFSSYGGMHAISKIYQSDWIVISASTSGSLARELLERGAKSENLSILFYLASDREQECPAGVVCDLTYGGNEHFGYQPIANYRSDSCPFCESGYILAELEGDQFLFQKRQNRRIRVKNKSQTQRARKLLDKTARRDIYTINLSLTHNESSLIGVDTARLLAEDETYAMFVRYVQRFAPRPLTYVVLSDMTETTARRVLKEAGIPLSKDIQLVDWESLRSVPSAEKGGALVLFGVLLDHARARQINATLRGVLPQGNVAYISALTVSESPEQYSDLKTFLTYGERGSDTFIFRSCHDLALPINDNEPSAWKKEYDLLTRICETPSAPELLKTRKKILESRPSSAVDLLFARNGDALSIKNDFVYLDTRHDIEKISQADILVVVANALASARCYDRPISSARNSEVEAEMRSSLYGHVLLCPENFKNYNDAILRAAFLRLAKSTELAYAVDEVCSAEMLEIIQSEIAAWEQRAGESLPEFILALACGRLSLDDRHIAQLQCDLKKLELPSYLHSLVINMPTLSS